jgi:hypothetical protein
MNPPSRSISPWKKSYRIPICLGHSVETNLRYYTYATKDSMDDLVDLFDSNCQEPAETLEVSPRSHQNVVIFKQKESSEHLISQAF